jgi:hypothetical protein
MCHRPPDAEKCVEGAAGKRRFGRKKMEWPGDLVQNDSWGRSAAGGRSPVHQRPPVCAHVDDQRCSCVDGTNSIHLAYSDCCAMLVGAPKDRMYAGELTCT